MRLLIVAGMLVLAISASVTPANARGLPVARNEGGCDAWGHGLRLYAAICHWQLDPANLEAP
jgi:hypothetical protein